MGFLTYHDFKRQFAGALAFCSLFFAFAASGAELKEAIDKPYSAPEISGIAHWINSDPFTKEKLAGKVVLIDFWAYSCVNCVRTLPHLRDWDARYRDKGLVIIGVHAPEFEFEKDLGNVKHAVEKWKITYPVALDNNMTTWNNFSNRYWPAHYLINKQGQVVYTHFGEGSYDITEHNIRVLLGLEEAEAQPVTTQTSHDDQTPETYLGTARIAHFGSTETVQKGTEAIYTYASTLPLHHWALAGKWTFDDEHIISGAGKASLTLHFTSKKVFLVLGSATGKPIKVSLKLNGTPVGSNAGKDAPDGMLTVDKHILYELISQPVHAEGTMELSTESAGLEAYAFTFGD